MHACTKSGLLTLRTEKLIWKKVLKMSVRGSKPHQYCSSGSLQICPQTAGVALKTGWLNLNCNVQQYDTLSLATEEVLFSTAVISAFWTWLFYSLLEQLESSHFQTSCHLFCKGRWFVVESVKIDFSQYCNDWIMYRHLLMSRCCDVKDFQYWRFYSKRSCI